MQRYTNSRKGGGLYLIHLKKLSLWHIYKDSHMTRTWPPDQISQFLGSINVKSELKAFIFFFVFFLLIINDQLFWYSDRFHYVTLLHWSHRGLSEAHSCCHNHRKPRRRTGKKTGGAAELSVLLKRSCRAHRRPAPFMVDIASQKSAMWRQSNCWMGTIEEAQHMILALFSMLQETYLIFCKLYAVGPSTYWKVQRSKCPGS